MTTANTSMAIIAIVAALGLIGVVPITIFTIPLQQQAYAAAQTSTTVVKIPVDFNLFIPCAGEEVRLTGKLHLLIHVTLDNAGGFHSNLRANPQGITGTGLTTGDKYQSTGASNTQFNTKVGNEETFVFIFNFIGQGNGNKLMVHVTHHVTVNANGIVTAIVDNFRVECK